jgi:hypothetical protein
MSGTKDLGSGMTLASCRDAAATDAECSNVMYSNDDSCVCVRAGLTCEFVVSSAGNNVYQRTCTGAHPGVHCFI